MCSFNMEIRFPLEGGVGEVFVVLDFVNQSFKLENMKKVFQTQSKQNDEG